MLTALLTLASVAGPHPVAFPPRLIGRWEKRASDCKSDLELRDTDGFVVVKPDKLEYYEAEAELLALTPLAHDTYQANVNIDENEEYFRESPRLRLVAPNRLVILSGAMRGTYARCRESK